MGQDPITTDAADGERTLAALVREALDGVPWSRARDLCRSGRVFVNGQPLLDPAVRVERGCTVEIRPQGKRRRPGVLPEEAIVHVDRDICVVKKSAGVLSVPYDADDRDTLVDLTRAALRRRGGKYDPELGVVHRLDKDTSGLLVFTRTKAAKRAMQTLFRTHDIERTYLALVHGMARDATHDTILIPNRGDGLRGSFGVFRRAQGKQPEGAKRAVTHVRVLRKGKGASLVECRLETGRQHQIRIHLSEAGTPLVGEPVYIRDYRGPRLEAPRPMLHATSLGFAHPRTEAPMRFHEPPPEDFQTCQAALGLGKNPG